MSDPKFKRNNPPHKINRQFKRADFAHKECDKLLMFCEKWFKKTEDYYLLKDSLTKVSKLINKIRTETITKTDENGNTD